MYIYKKGDVITTEEQSLTANSEIYECLLADEDSAFFKQINGNDGFFTHNDQPIEGFRMVDKQELVEHKSTGAEDSLESIEGLAKSIDDSIKNTNEFKKDELMSHIIAEIYIAHLENVETSNMVSVNESGVLASMSTSDRAIFKTKAAMKELFNFQV